ncbi:MAG TPA: arsenosugar biosynthesis radical SAM (seleno)protein ArsS [Candidatus Saccharimonadales bacterium]|nr:arsenosugar biosynthesis radical SAM (seleno)protein ArsS [Candidatus Saccharimonadales bacterium]
MNHFESRLIESGITLARGDLTTLQINLGRKCNQACRHCHVEAAPWRTEMMEQPTAKRIAEWIEMHRPTIVDLTGGAPELNDCFPFLIEASRQTGAHVIDRCNLTIIEEDGFGHLPAYLAQHQVEVVASLPCYSAANVNQQRGNGVFEKSISALRKLNAVGYGTELPLHLIYNPLGPKLPPSQIELEAEYKEALSREFGIVFNNLYALANQPIGRFAEDLRKQGSWEPYLKLLRENFNPGTVQGLMCRNTISVGWRGEIYDCDFNQMLGMQIEETRPLFLWDISPGELRQHDIRTGDHCLACTAGCGSSCTGSLTTANV